MPLRGCGWTANFEQLQWANQTDSGQNVAAGPRILNSYNRIIRILRRLCVAAGPRILNSYNYSPVGPTGALLRLDREF